MCMLVSLHGRPWTLNCGLLDPKETIKNSIECRNYCLNCHVIHCVSASLALLLICSEQSSAMKEAGVWSTGIKAACKEGQFSLFCIISDYMYVVFLLAFLCITFVMKCCTVYVFVIHFTKLLYHMKMLYLFLQGESLYWGRSSRRGRWWRQWMIWPDTNPFKHSLMVMHPITLALCLALLNQYLDIWCKC